MIGERLEEGRKRKAVSIREAAEATKIRGDYLLAMEDNSFDIPLPQIYIRGFLKNYARYLKLDPNKILTDYDAHLLGKSTRPTGAGTRGDRDSLGHVEIPDERDEVEEEQVVITEAPEEEGPEPELTFNLGRSERPTPPPPTLDREATRHDQESWNENKTLYIKIGVVFAAILLVSIILIVMIQLLTREKDTPAINPELASTPVETIQTEPEVVTGGITRDSILITASDNLTVIVEQTVDRKRLFSGSLNTGETLSLEKEGPVSIRFTNGSALTIEKDGQKFRPQQTGVGRTVVD
ncbi:MAG: RodZ domain-containing protein [Puniceicoccaceae bacterium]